MLLEEISINNFGSFVGKNKVVFGPTLTLLIGDNGDGKTTFFDALKWVLATTDSDDDEVRVRSALRPPTARFSEKVKRELNPGDEAECFVELVYTHKGQRFIIKKSFYAYADFEGIKFSDSVKHTAYRENSSGERIQEDAISVIKQTFNTSIQMFCLFKGEAELNVLNNKKALGQLLSELSDISQFDIYKERAEKLEAEATRAYARELRGHKGTAKRAQEIQAKLSPLQEKRDAYEKLISRMDTEIRDAKAIYEKLKKNEAVWTRFRDLDEERKDIIEKIASLQQTTKINLNINLLDELWVLRDFPPVFKEFKKKVSFWWDERQRLINERKIEEESNKAKAQLSEELRMFLPIGVPDESIMEKLIETERCEICGREAKKGTPAYEHMCQRLSKLKEYLSGLRVDSQELPELFTSDHISEIRGIYSKLTGDTQARLSRSMGMIDPILLKLGKDQRKLSELRQELRSIEERIEDFLMVNNIEDEKDLLSITQEQFDESSRNVGNAEGRKQQLKLSVDSCDTQIGRLHEELRRLGEGNPQINFSSQVKDVLAQIVLAFTQGREKNADDFVIKLQERANYFHEKLSWNDFRGCIVLQRKEGTDELSIRLEDSSGQEILLPNAALKTSQYLAVLFAISDLTSNKNNEAYPLVFDAPTSSFSLGREDEFYNTVERLNKQCIILTKDLLLKDGSLDMDRVSRLNGKVFRLQKAPGVKLDDLSTVETQIISM